MTITSPNPISTEYSNLENTAVQDSAHLHCVHVDDERTVEQRIQVATEQCRQNGVRFTMLRRQIYQFILQADKPIGAYDLLGYLQQARLQEREKEGGEASGNAAKSKPVAPPTVYRTLEFLLAQGFIHQLTSINAFVPCCHPRDAHVAAFLICEYCGQVQECSSLPVHEMLEFAKQTMGFAVKSSVMEMSGKCQNCQIAQNPDLTGDLNENNLITSSLMGSDVNHPAGYEVD